MIDRFRFRRPGAAPIAALICLALTAGCSSVGHRPGYSTNRPAGVSVSAGVDWQWRVSGDTIIRPEQVFSANSKTFVQMRPGQPIPAVFVDNTPVPFDVSPPYIVITGVPHIIDLMVQNYRAVLVHSGDASGAASASNHALDRNRLQRTAVSNSAIRPGSGSTFVPMPVVRPSYDPVAATISRVSDGSSGAAWVVQEDDAMLSLAVTRWAAKAGRRLRWESSVDLPVIRKAEYHTSDFFTALSAVLADADSGSFDFRYTLDDGVVVITSVSR